MKRYAKPMTVLVTPPDSGVSMDAAPESSFDIESLLEQSLNILSREIRNLARMSASGKLEGSDAKDLVSYVKLLSELKQEQQEKAASMTDEELANAAKQTNES